MESEKPLVQLTAASVLFDAQTQTFTSFKAGAVVVPKSAEWAARWVKTGRARLVVRGDAPRLAAAAEPQNGDGDGDAD